jgi:hypothetical protein
VKVELGVEDALLLNDLEHNVVSIIDLADISSFQFKPIGSYTSAQFGTTLDL